MIGAVSPTLDDLRVSADRFAATLTTADPAAIVPACPGWSVHDLVHHIGGVHAWATAIVSTGDRARPPQEEPGADLSGWYAARATALVDVLAAADPAAVCWNFAGVDQTVGFWLRRQVHEIRMHLVDLDQAHGRPPELDPAMSADGLDETLTTFLPRMHHAAPADLAGEVSLVATDTGHGWTLSPRTGSWPEVRRGGEPAETRLEGTAAALLLLWWKRADAGVRREGDTAALERLLASRLTS